MNRLMLPSNVVGAEVAVTAADGEITAAMAAVSVVSADKEMVGTGREVRKSFNLLVPQFFNV